MMAINMLVVFFTLLLTYVYRHQKSITRMSDLREKQLENAGIKRWSTVELAGKSSTRYSMTLPDDWNPAPIKVEDSEDLFVESCDFVIQSIDRKKQIGCIVTKNNAFSELYIYQDDLDKSTDVTTREGLKKLVTKDRNIWTTDFEVEIHGQNFHYIYMIFEVNSQIVELIGRMFCSLYLKNCNEIQLIMESFDLLSNNFNEEDTWKVLEFRSKDLKFSIKVPKHWISSREPINDSFVFLLENGRATELIGCTCENKLDFNDLTSYKNFAEKDLRESEEKDITFLRFKYQSKNIG